MFTKYWRSYPWFLQLLLFAMMVFIFLSLGQLMIATIIPRITGIDIADIKATNSNASLWETRTMLYVNIIGSIMLFTVPCLIFAYLTTPNPANYLGLRKPGKPYHWLLAGGVMIGLLLVTAYCEEFIVKNVKLPASMQQQQDASESLFKNFLNLQSTQDRIWVVLGLAIIPAIGEELLFRGVLLRFAHKRNHRMVISILITSVFFMLAHGTILGYPFILLAGVALGCIYWYTGSLLCAIFGHLLFNGTQITLAFMSGGVDNTSATPTPFYILLVGLAVLGISFYMLYKTRTPLPYNWSDDYTNEELKAH